MALLKNLFGLYLVFLFITKISGAPSDTTTYTNKYSFYNLGAAVTTVPNAAIALFPATVDTALYLGDSYTNAYAPTKNVDYGLVYTGQ